jgi:hypothetical protein
VWAGNVPTGIAEREPDAARTEINPQDPPGP